MDEEVKEVRVTQGPRHLRGRTGWLHEDSGHVYFYDERKVPKGTAPTEYTVAEQAYLATNLTYVRVTANDKKKEDKKDVGNWYGT